MTRWSLFLQTLSLLHHFLGLYCAKDDLALPRQLGKLDTFDFLLLDDLGYLP